MIDFQELAQKHPSQESRIKRMEKRYKTADILLELRDNPVVFAIIQELEMKIDAINSKLLDDATVTERQRDKLFAERDAWEWFLQKFIIAEHTKANTELKISKL